MNPTSRAGPLAVVLSGGGARGAYEIGVLRHIFGQIAPRVGPSAAPRLYCGTSVGAINACTLAAHAADLGQGVRALEDRWSKMELRHVFRRGWGDLAGLARWLIGAGGAEGLQSILDPAPLAELVRVDVPWRALHDNVTSGRVQAVTVSATDVETGHTVVFHEGQGPGGWPLPPSTDPTVEWQAARLTPQHALASAAIPFLFPTVRVQGRLMSDGSVRQNTPLSPALRLGAERVLVIGLRASRTARTERRRQPRADQRALSSPLFLFGKLLDALLLDRVENDLASLRRINQALAAPGPAFAQHPVALALEASGAVLRPVRDLFLQPSRDLGALATSLLERPSVKGRLEGPAGYLLRRMGEAASSAAASDTLSYLLFDGEYARELMSLGEADARKLGPQIEEFLAG